MATGTGLREMHHDSSDVDESLQQILHSKEFHGALQLQSLLKFIVENSIRGHEDALKERIIGISVFDRRPDYETADDPIVRSRVRQLRKRLERYYASDEAKDSAVEIIIPKGSYKPVFFPRAESGTDKYSKKQVVEERFQTGISLDVAAEENSQSEPVMSAPLRTRAGRFRVWLTVLAFACVSLLAFTVWMGITKWPRNNLDLFWMPIFNGNKNVIIYTGSARVYLPTTIYSYSVLSSQPGDIDQPFVPGIGSSLSRMARAQELAAKDMVIAPQRYIRSEAIETNLKIAALLNAHHVNVEARVEPNLPFADFSSYPVILVGAYSNDWTLSVTQNLPYFFDRGGRIHERGGQGRTWSTPPAKDDKITHDYAVVARLLDSKAGGPIMIAAGITTCGTEAAAEFATDPAQLQKLGSLPKSALQGKNIEIVLQASLINCNPTSLGIVALRYW